MIAIRYFAAYFILLWMFGHAMASTIIDNDLHAKIDSLQQVIADEQVSDSLMMDAYRHLGWEKRNINIREALQYTYTALEYAEYVACASCKGTLLANLGNIYWRKGHFEKAFEYLLDARDIAEDIEDRMAYARTLNHLGILYSGQGLHDKALKQYFEAYRVYDALDSIVNTSMVLNNIGLVYYYREDYDEAEEFHLRSLEIKQDLDDERRNASSLHNLGLVYKKRGELDKAHDYLEKSRHILAGYPDTRDLAIVFRSLGKLYLKEEAYAEALNYLNEAEDVFVQVGDMRSIARVLMYLGEVHYAMKAYAIAEDYLKRSLELSKKYQFPSQIKNAYAILSNIMVQKDNYRLAYDYQKKSKEIADSIQDRESMQRIIELQMRYEREQKASEIDLLQKSNEIAELNLEKQRLFQKLLIIFIVLILFILFAIYYRFREARRINRMLESQKAEIIDSNNKLKQLNNNLIEEKRRVDELNKKLRESEDHLKAVNKTKDQFFSIISHDLRNPFASIVSFSRILKRDIQDLSREELQELARELDKSVLKINSLLENLLQWSRAQTGNIKFKPEYFELHSLISETISLFLGAARDKNVDIIDNAGDFIVYGDLNMTETIIRNLLSNAIKYSNPGGQVVIASRKLNGFLEVRVEDEGVGIREEDQQKLFRSDSLFTTYGTNDEKGSGLGLLLCKEFVQKQGGSISLESKVDEGTVFRFTIPLEAPDKG